MLSREDEMLVNNGLMREKGYTYKPVSTGIFTIVECKHRGSMMAHPGPSGVKVFRKFTKDGPIFQVRCPACGNKSHWHPKPGEALGAFRAGERIAWHSESPES